MPPLRQRVHDHLGRAVRAALEPRRAEWAPLGPALAGAAARADALALCADGVEGRLRGLGAALQRFDAPFAADFTMDEVLRRHPGAAAVLARHHLPRCAGCAVRTDETLAEAAEAYGLDLGEMLEELGGLLARPVDGPA